MDRRVRPSRNFTGGSRAKIARQMIQTLHDNVDMLPTGGPDDCTGLDDFEMKLNHVWR